MGNSTPIPRAFDIKSLPEYKKKAQKHLILKLDRKLFLLIVPLEIFSFMNRVTLGFLKLMDFHTDLNISQSDSRWATSLFYLAYLIFAVPSVWLFRRVQPNLFLSFSMLIWGGITIGMAFIKNAPQLLIINFLNGIAISGYFPGSALYISLWYRKEERIKRISYLVTAACAGALMAAFFMCIALQMSGVGGLHSWQWMYLLVGLPVIPLGIITFLFLKNTTEAIKALNPSEQILLTDMLREGGTHENDSHTKFSLPEALNALVDKRLYLFAAIGIVDLGMIKCLTTFLPLLVAQWDFSTLGKYLMATPAYLVACAFCLIVGRRVTHETKPVYPLILCLLLDLFGFLLMVFTCGHSTIVTYIGFCCALSGTFSALIVLLFWLTVQITGHVNRATAVGFVLGIGQIMGVLAPWIYHADDAPNYRLGNVICVVSLVFGLLFTLILNKHLENTDDSSQSSQSRTVSAATSVTSVYHHAD